MDKSGYWTVKVTGNVVAEAKAWGYHAYYANGVTTIETGLMIKASARKRCRQFGEVLYIFE